MVANYIILGDDNVPEKETKVGYKRGELNLCLSLWLSQDVTIPKQWHMFDVCDAIRCEGRYVVCKSLQIGQIMM